MARLLVDAIDSIDAALTLLDQARRECDSFLRSVGARMPEPLATMAGYHLGWWDALRKPVTGGAGKYLRPALVFGAAAACGGNAEAAIPAAAIELMHNFSIVHDDIMDGDTIRHGRPTIWAVWGTSNALLLGDALHAEAIRVLADLHDQALVIDAVVRLEGACIELCRGQYEDCMLERCTTVTVQQYQRMVAGKTAALMECACALGALIARAGEETIGTMGRFGFELGMAFQYVDDLIGIWGDPQITGKSASSDLSRRKATLPVVVAMGHHCPAATELAELYQSDRVMSAGDIARAADLVETAGGKEITKKLAAERVQAAINALPDPSQSQELVALAHLVTGRSK